MTHYITIRNNQTGEERVYVDDFDYSLDEDDRTPSYRAMWYYAQGNASCDCNRHRYFNNGKLPYDDEVECGDDVLYSITRFMCDDVDITEEFMKLCI